MRVTTRDRAQLLVADIEATGERLGLMTPRLVEDAVLRHATSPRDARRLWLAAHAVLLERGYEVGELPAPLSWRLAGLAALVAWYGLAAGLAAML